MRPGSDAHGCFSFRGAGENAPDMAAEGKAGREGLGSGDYGIVCIREPCADPSNSKIPDDFF